MKLNLKKQLLEILNLRTKDPSPFGCKCTELAHHILGDGCDECNPELHAELLKEQAEDEEED